MSEKIDPTFDVEANRKAWLSECSGTGDDIKTLYQDPDMEHNAEEAECAHMVLDDKGVPRKEGKNTLSLAGRIIHLTTGRSAKE